MTPLTRLERHLLMTNALVEIKIASAQATSVQPTYNNAEYTLRFILTKCKTILDALEASQKEQGDNSTTIPTKPTNERQQNSQRSTTES